jgi:hypothetical protein
VHASGDKKAHGEIIIIILLYFDVSFKYIYFDVSFKYTLHILNFEGMRCLTG